MKRIHRGKKEMKKLKFKPEQFGMCWHQLKAISCQEIAKKSQELFDEWYKEHVIDAPIAYGWRENSPSWILIKKPEHTHSVKLIAKEKLKKDD